MNQGLPGALTSPVMGIVVAAVLGVIAGGCLFTPVGRRVVILLALPALPYAVAWLYRLTTGLPDFAGGAPSAWVLFLPPLISAALVATARPSAALIARATRR